ncbi:hypothetical protein HU200_025965 [Digitaria exilis]|uniref:Epidermal patterning factor-like protein n=1 Tax=Digitaria exilis TaxID=1010633 RepID=A0A835C1I4_9POAL|nr:hypothetical protein HU200_025965 [Digitaria exilis]
MESSRGRRRWRWSGRSLLKLAGLCLAVAICLFGVRSLACSDSGCRARTVLLRSGKEPSEMFSFLCRCLLRFGNFVFRSNIWRRTAAPCGNQGCSTGGEQWRRRRLMAEGPGSYPPRCTSKCGDCSPCYPVHVAVPPGVPVTTEYYPEAWRCKCGNRLYMP